MIDDNTDCKELTYQNYDVFNPIIKHLGSVCKEGEFVVWRNAFRWMTQDGVISNAYEMFSLTSIARDNNWDIIHNFNHVGIVKAREPK